MQDERSTHACPARTCAHAHNMLAHAHIHMSMLMYMAICAHLHMCMSTHMHVRSSIAAPCPVWHAHAQENGISMPMLIGFSLHSVLCPAHP